MARGRRYRKVSRGAVPEEPVTDSPADVIRRVVEEVEARMFNNPYGAFSGIPEPELREWVALLAAGLRVAVEALEEIAERGRRGCLDSPGVKRAIAFDALALIAEKVGGK